VYGLVFVCAAFVVATVWLEERNLVPERLETKEAFVEVVFSKRRPAPLDA
jgi:hypothetical protein